MARDAPPLLKITLGTHPVWDGGTAYFTPGVCEG